MIAPGRPFGIELIVSAAAGALSLIRPKMLKPDELLMSYWEVGETLTLSLC